MNRNELRAFEREFPDEDSCLEWLKDQVFPDGIYCEPCGRVTKHHRVRSRRSYSCDRCGHHVHPTAGTIYHKSRTPLTKWFYATYVLSSIDPDIPITELQHELGVTYKTAWRMTHLIRSMFDDEGPDQEPESGETDPAHVDRIQQDPPDSVPPRRRHSRAGGLFRRLTRGG